MSAKSIHYLTRRAKPTISSLVAAAAAQHEATGETSGLTCTSSEPTIEGRHPEAHVGSISSLACEPVFCHRRIGTSRRTAVGGQDRGRAAGHGRGSRTVQRLSTFADSLAFMLWQFGEPGFELARWPFVVQALRRRNPEPPVAAPEALRAIRMR